MSISQSPNQKFQSNNLLSTPYKPPENSFKKTGKVVPFRTPFIKKTPESPQLPPPPHPTNIRHPVVNPQFLNPPPIPYLSTQPPILSSKHRRGSSQLTKHEQKLRERSMTEDTKSEFEETVNNYNIDVAEEIRRLRRENDGLREELARGECECKAPYVQEEVEYLRRALFEHIQKRHKRR